jgi:hypothetical protein
MIYYVIKVVISAALIVAISEISKKSSLGKNEIGKFK